MKRKFDTIFQNINVKCNNWPHQLWEKLEIFFSLSAVWLLFGQNSTEIIVDKVFSTDFDQIVTKQPIDKQN